MNENEKVILVTGSSRGIGRGIAITLAKKGYSVAINYAGNKQAAEETNQLCREESIKAGFNSRFKIFQGDISLKDDRKNLIASVVSAYGDFHGLVNNAGVAPKERKDILEMGEVSFDRLIDTNLKGAFFLSQLASNYWLTLPKTIRGFRSLIFITSVSSEMISVNRSEYCITKSALSMTAKLFATRLAAENVGVYELRPGIIQTDMTGGVKDKYDVLIADGFVPQKRWGQPDDLGKAVSSLVSGDFSFSTGSVIHVDGALHLPSL